MKIYGLLLLSWTFALASSEYPKYKPRGPIAPPRPPPHSQQFASKKWHQPVKRHPVRSRPIPVHMPVQHKIPMGIHPAMNRPIAPPVRSFWKNTQTTFNKIPFEKHPHQYPQAAPIPPEKTFLSSPPISVQEYDYHIESNSIPIQGNTVKQVGEKGPIHTIPAPNLSLKDKPSVIEEVKSNNYNPETTATFVQIQKAHQYQVTENAENNFNRQQQYLNQPQFKSNQPEIFLIRDQQQQQQQQQQQFIHPVVQENLDLDPKLYDILKIYPQQQQQHVVETYTVPVLHQPELNILSSQQQQQDYNFDQNQNNKVLTTTYNVQPNNNEASVQTISRKVFDSLTQSQLVQNYFDTRETNNNGNVEADAKPSGDVEIEEKIKDGDPESEFYVSLPNKEAAESLASLQAAGKINSNLMEMSQRAKGGHGQVSIYVPDDNEDVRGDDDYDEYSQEIAEEQQENDEEFGQKIKKS